MYKEKLEELMIETLSKLLTLNRHTILNFEYFIIDIRYHFLIIEFSYINQTQCFIDDLNNLYSKIINIETLNESHLVIDIHYEFIKFEMIGSHKYNFYKINNYTDLLYPKWANYKKEYYYLEKEFFRWVI